MNINKIKEKLNTKEYDFLKTNKDLGNNIILLTLGGSHAYGTNTETSDIDIRGVALNKPQELLGLSEFEQFIDLETDTTIYSFNKIIKLLLNCNPNVVEILGCRDEHYFILSEEGKMIKDNVSLFLSKIAFSSFGGYANAQLRRLQNALARDNYPQSEKEKHIAGSIENQMVHFNNVYTRFKESSINIYLDDTNKEGFDKEIYMDIDLKHYPLRDFKAIYSEMSNVVKDYDKLNHRNKKKTEISLNKHSMHLVRLFLMGIDILSGAGVCTYRDKDLDLLMSIRQGNYMKEDGSYRDEFFELVDKLEKDFQYAYKNSTLPQTPDMKKVEEFVIEINKKSLWKEN